jgi:AsmA-like C-terminal region
MQAVSRHHYMIRGTLLLPVLLMAVLSTAVYILNHSRLQDLLAQQLQTQLGIEVSTLRLQLFPTASIDVSHLVVRDAHSAEPSLRAGRASLSIRLWPFITKRMLMLTLEASDPEVTIRRDAEGRWHWPLIDIDQTEASSESSQGQWLLTDVVLRDGTLRMFDPSRLTSEGVAVRHVEATLHSDPAGARADVLFHGATDDGGDLNLSGTLQIVGSDATKRAHSKQFNGTLRFQGWNFSYWLERTGHDAIPQDTTERGTFSASVRLDFQEDVHGFNVFASDISANTGWLAMHGHVLIRHAGTEHPVYAMALSTAPVTSETLLAHIPSSWLPQEIHAMVSDHQLAGTIEMQSVGLRGRMDVLCAPDEWRVVAKVVGASGRWGKTTAFIRNLSGTVLLDRDSAEVMHASGEINGVHLASEKLVIAEMDLIPTIDARLNAYGEVAQVMPVLEQVTQGTDAHRVVQTIRNATGHVRMAVHLAGPLVPKPSLRLITAVMRLEEAGATLGTGLSIGAIQGLFEADAHEVVVKHLSGVFQGIHFEAQGNINVESAPRLNNVQVAVSSDGTAIQELLGTYLPSAKGLRLGGPVRSTVLLSGTPTAVRYSGMIDVTQSEIRLPSILHKKQGVPGLLECQGKLFDKTRVLVDRLRLRLSQGEVRGAGEIDLTHGSKFRWHAEAGPLSVHDLVENGMNIPITEGIVHASAAVSGEGTDWNGWLPSGSIALRGGMLALPGLAQSLSDVNGRLRFTPQGAVLDNVSFFMGEADVKLTGIVEHWRTRPRARLMVESSHLNVSRFVPRSATNPGSASMRVPDWIQSKEAAITFLVKQLRYERLILKTVSGEIHVNGQKAILNHLRAKTAKGLLSGRLEARFARQDQIDVAAHLSVDGIPAQHVLPAASDETEHLQGDVSMDGALYARIDPASPVKTTLNTGSDGIALKVTHGHLHQDPVLTKVLKLLNLPAVLLGQVDLDRGGIPFDSLSARITATNGVLSSEDIVFDSPVIKVAGAGSADIGDNGLDLALAVSPVASYSELIAQIPLLGPLIVGDHSGFTTAVFQARGPLLDPNVAFLPLLSLARGVTGYPRIALDVLTHTIKLPPHALAYLAE